MRVHRTKVFDPAKKCSPSLLQYYLLAFGVCFKKTFNVTLKFMDLPKKSHEFETVLAIAYKSNIHLKI